MKSRKKIIDEATDFIISCWDENNKNDMKSFDQRLSERINTLDEDVQNCVKNICLEDDSYENRTV